MSNVFVCQIDQKTFSSEDELVKHMITDHTTKNMENKESKEVEYIVHELKKAFPFANIEVYETHSNEKDFGVYSVNMNWGEKGEDFQFYIGEWNELDCFQNQFDTVEEAVNFYQKFFKIEKEGKEILEEKFQPEEICVVNFWDGTSDTDAFVSFEMIKNGKSYFEKFEFGTTKEEFARKMSGYFDKVVEGEITVIEDCSGSGSEPEYLLDGVPVWHLIKRGKKMKIEILEEKEDLR